MPQMYINQSENKLLVLWKTDETLELCLQSARQQGLVFPRGWGNWKNATKQKQALIIRQICLKYLGENEIFYEQNGKPFLANGRLSLSHSQHFVAVNYHAHQEIGVDVEEPHERIKKIAHRFLHPDEKNRDYTIPELTAIWSVKESVFKKYGGKTAFFAENIITRLPNRLSDNCTAHVTVCAETGIIEQKVELICCNEYILASTL
jgi:phosphopantetheinyl transferase